MFLIDQPYLSNFLLSTIKNLDIPVVNTAAAREFSYLPGTRFIEESDAIDLALSTPAPQFYSPSENALGWVAEHLQETPLPGKIKLFKDKVLFRELLQPVFPDFFFKAVQFSDLDNLDVTQLPYPFIIKPATGFFSLGVHKVTTPADWPQIKQTIQTSVAEARGVFPKAVLDTSIFIIEGNIPGEEFAFDAYFNEAGQPVILGIFKHLFASATDVSDRVYITSREIIQDHLPQCTAFLHDIGRLTGVRNFPVHVEVRIDKAGNLIPIEVNPMRFGGWCTTADLSAFAFGFNPYELFFANQAPDWEAHFAGKDELVYSLVVLDNSTGIPAIQIKAFDFDAVQASFECVLEVRQIDHTAYPVFGFIFTETRADNLAELEHILTSDLREFVEV